MFCFKVIAILLLLICAQFYKFHGETISNLSNPTTPLLPTSNTPTTTQPPTRLFNCTCDLTLSSCDANCCCDIDCDEATRTGVFTCSQSEEAALPLSCVRTDSVYLFNSLGSFRDGILCVQIDNNPSATRYSEPRTVSDLESFQNALSSHGPSFQYPQLYMPPSQPVFYRLGDPVCAVYTHNFTPLPAYLSLPHAVTSNACNAHSPIKFYTNSQSTCTQFLDSLQLSCIAGSALDATAYTERVQIFKLPQCYTTVPANLTDLTLSVHTSCVDSNSATVLCPNPLTPVFNATTNSCHNALTRISYSITANGKFGISSINATLTLSRTTSLTLQQTFNVYFSSLSDGPSPISLSGSPGYRDGYPVTVANLLSPDSNTTQLVPQMLTILQPLAVCDATKRVSIGFRRNTASGCLYRFNISDINNRCNHLREETRSLLIGTRYSFVGILGHSQLTPDSENTDSWLASLYEESPLQSQQTSGCSVYTQLTVQLLIASTGPISSPERSVRGMKYRLYYSSVDSTCAENTCNFQNNIAQKSLIIRTSVEFIDISETPQVRQRATPGTANILPDDFFFPFLVSSADKLRYPAIGLIMYLIINCFIALV